MIEDDSRETEQQQSDPAAPGREAEEAAGNGEEQQKNGEQPEVAQGEATPQEPEGQATEPVEESTPPEPEASEEAEGEAETSEEKKAAPGAELEPIAIEPRRELSTEERARMEAEAEERARAEAEATAEAGEEPAPTREPVVELPAEARIQATGKRKTSIARVVVRAGDGGFEINKRGLEEYFPRHQHQTLARQPLVTSGYEGRVDVRVRVHGGGVAGQAGAVRHGLARALTEIDPELRGELKRRGLLTRDARAKERRKAGLKKARKRPQFSKR